MPDPALQDVLRGMKGPQKAAILMMAVGEEHCARLFGMMHEDEIKEIFLQVAIYCGIPASLDAFKTASGVFKERGI